MFGLIVDNLGAGEVLVVLVLLMVVVGPDRLPEMARKIGRGIVEARTKFSSMSDEVRGVVDDPAMQPLREIGEFAMRPRQKLSEIVRMAEIDLSEEAAELKALVEDAQAVLRPAEKVPPALTSPEAKGTRDGVGAPASIADLPEPGDPPGPGPQYPTTMDDKAAGLNAPVDAEVAAQRREEARLAAETDRGPADAAFTARAAPLGSRTPEPATEPAPDVAGLPSPTSTPVASTAFTARGRPLGGEVVPDEEAPPTEPTGVDRPDDPADPADGTDPAASADSDRAT